MHAKSDYLALMAGLMAMTSNGPSLNPMLELTMDDMERRTLRQPRKSTISPKARKSRTKKKKAAKRSRKRNRK